MVGRSDRLGAGCCLEGRPVMAAFAYGNSNPTANSRVQLVTVDGKLFVFMHEGREVWDCEPLDADDAGRIVAEQLSEKKWFTADHHEQFVMLVAGRE